MGSRDVLLSTSLQQSFLDVMGARAEGLLLYRHAASARKRAHARADEARRRPDQYGA